VENLPLNFADPGILDAARSLPEVRVKALRRVPNITRKLKKNPLSCKGIAVKVERLKQRFLKAV